MPEELQAVDRMHLDIADDDIDIAVRQLLQGGSGTRRFQDHPDPQAPQNRQDQRSCEIIVLDDQDH
jgi:hypothetical protein